MIEIEIGSYVKLKSDPTQIYRVSAIIEEIVAVYKKDGTRLTLLLSEIELGDDDDMIAYEEGKSIFFE